MARIPDYAPEDDPHEPTNLPEDLEERAERTFEYTIKRSGSGHTRYVKPMYEGGNDYYLMLELMGIEPGTVFSDSAGTYVAGTFFTTTVNWPTGKHDAPAFNAQMYDGDRFHDDGERVRFSPGEDYKSIKVLWESYIHGNVDVHGHIMEVLD